MKVLANLLPEAGGCVKTRNKYFTIFHSVDAEFCMLLSQFQASWY